MKKYALIFCTILLLNIYNNTAYAQNTPDAHEVGEIAFPVRYIAESLGGSISWDRDTRTAVLKYENKTLELKIGSKAIITNGSIKIIKDEIKTSGGRTVLPINILNEELGTELSEEDCLNIVARKFVDLLKQGDIKEASSLLSKSFSSYLTPTNLESLAESITELQLEEFNAQYWQNSVHRIIGIPFKLEDNIYYSIKFDNNGKIDELGTVEKSDKTSAAPKYTSANKYTETEVTFGNGIWKLSGTLTLPEGSGPFPVVILVHGAGPNDRNETTGYLKPFRDLAYGLAARNIAVLRYDKRTLVHSTKINLVGNITLNEEVEQDVYEAAGYLKTVDKIDKSNIIVLGHGLGGYALPQILTTGSENFKAGIIMSGSSRPQYDIIPEYLEYLSQKGMASKRQLEYVKSQVSILKSENFNFRNPPEEYTLGNEYYYNYMKNYDVLGLAKKLEKPVLVMQGERDFQVNPAVDFVNWESAFEKNNRAEFKLYTKLNYLYTEGEGDSTPLEYYEDMNIPEYVIDDIAGFINKLE
ncbi:MAG: putative hydrolase [Eubacterium sp.]|nr:putative hydrolase [Eubacterium sp.]